MFDAEEAEPLELRWDGDRLDGVAIAATWQDDLGPQELIGRVIDEFREHRGRRAGWRSRVRLRDIPIDQLDEFVTAVRAARAESPIGEPVERKTEHVRSRWRGGELLGLVADIEWLVAAPRQEIADELLQILDVPVDTEGPAVNWLMRMMGEPK